VSLTSRNLHQSLRLLLCRIVPNLPNQTSLLYYLIRRKHSLFFLQRTANLPHRSLNYNNQCNLNRSPHLNPLPWA
jgi:hypothetical protein